MLFNIFYSPSNLRQNKLARLPLNHIQLSRIFVSKAAGTIHYGSAQSLAHTWISLVLKDFYRVERSSLFYGVLVTEQA